MWPEELIAVAAGICLHIGYFHRGEHHMYGGKYLQACVFLFCAANLALNSFCQLPLTSALALTTKVSSCVSLGIYGSLLCYRLLWHPLNRFPGPFAARISSVWYSTQVAKRFDSHRVALNLFKQYGPFVRVGSSDLMIAHPLGVPALHSAQSKCRKASWYDEDWPRLSLHTLRDHKFHHERRRVWSQVFSEKAIRSFESRIVVYNEALMNRLSESAGQPINASKWANYYSYDVMGELAFGKDFGMLKSGEERFAVSLLDEAMDIHGFKFPTWLFRMLIFTPGLMGVYWKFIKYCDEQLATKMEEELMGRKNDKLNLVQALLAQAGLRPSPAELTLLRSDTKLTIVAGSDTGAATLSHIFYELARHPEHVIKLRDELLPLINPDGSFSHKAVSEATHLNATITETLRLYPVPPTAIVRKTPPEGIMIDGTFIPGEMNVWTPQYVIGRSEQAYERPEEFLPERWYEKREEQMVKEKVALVVADVVSRFDIEFPAGEDGSKFIDNVKDHFTWGLADLMLCFKPREQSTA
ncbi:hypothetical protein N0V90_011136 [Kalmusia sp. IMI 367209]|nr:hypothetical protein N0V90_011136 [Kalmusia sp. IMI 367209]